MLLNNPKYKSLAAIVCLSLRAFTQTLTNDTFPDLGHSHALSVEPSMLQELLSRRSFLSILLKAADKEIFASIRDLHIRIKKKRLIDHTVSDCLNSFPICTSWEEGVFIVDHIVGDHS